MGAVSLLDAASESFVTARGVVLCTPVELRQALYARGDALQAVVVCRHCAAEACAFQELELLFVPPVRVICACVLNHASLYACSAAQRASLLMSGQKLQGGGRTILLWKNADIGLPVRSTLPSLLEHKEDAQEVPVIQRYLSRPELVCELSARTNEQRRKSGYRLYGGGGRLEN